MIGPSPHEIATFLLLRWPAMMDSYPVNAPHNDATASTFAIALVIRRTGRYGIRPARSFRLDTRELDHLAPLLGVIGDELAEVGGRAWKCSGTQLGEPRLHLGIGESRVDLLVELLDDLGRRGLRCADADPETRFGARPELTHSRHVG